MPRISKLDYVKASIENPIYAVWFLGPNGHGLPMDLIKKAIKVKNVKDMRRFSHVDCFMFKSQIEAYCYKVHKKIKK